MDQTFKDKLDEELNTEMSKAWLAYCRKLDEEWEKKQEAASTSKWSKFIKK